MKHLVEAHDEMSKEQQEHIDVNSVDHSVKFTIQNGPIKEVGVNGVQATDMLVYSRHLFTSLNNSYPCDENRMAINAIDLAIEAQKMRTRDREKRGVEGKSEA